MEVRETEEVPQRRLKPGLVTKGRRYSRPEHIEQLPILGGHPRLTNGRPRQRKESQNLVGGPRLLAYFGGFP